MLGEHCRYDLVARAAADGGGVFGAAEDRVSAEEGRGYEPGHAVSNFTLSNSGLTIYEIWFRPSIMKYKSEQVDSARMA
jgi:hypothetical protein